MTTTGERLPHLDALSEAQKDELIRVLWDDLQGQRAQCRDLEQRLTGFECRTATASSPESALLAELRNSGGKKHRQTASPSRSKVRLGSGLGLLRSGLVLGALVFAALALTVDQGIGWYQSQRLEQKRLASLKLHHAAFAGLLVELVKVAYEPVGQSYRLTMAMKNLDPEHPIYVMLSPVRVFEQSGLAWKEVPARAASGQATGVIKLADRHIYETVFEPNLKDWTELMPGYMHIRLENNRLISQRTEPDDDIVERNDRYYVYLKPHGADNEAIRKRMKYPGEPPVYIPMPPH
jgi:hypothetical protein